MDDPYRRGDAPEVDYADAETEVSSERFDRVAFALEALARLGPPKLKVAVCQGDRMRVESGRVWGDTPGNRWALLSVSPRSSRRAIAFAVATLGGVPPAPWVLDALLQQPFAHARRHGG